MFFGLTNSPATFQAMMDDIFHVEIAEGWLKVYMDDILIATFSSRDEHLAKVCIILQHLKDFDLFLKPKKCHFAQKSVNYLSVVVGSEGIAMDSVKVDGLIQWPTPTSVTEVCSFLGFCNFYKPFIADYVHIARPLHDLTKKGAPFVWSSDHANAFQTLKDRFASQPVLSTIDPEKPFTLQTDASAFAVGATLMQLQSDGHEHPMAFFSGSLQLAEINYDIYDRELLAIIKAIRHWCHHLLGARHPFRILTDHNNLTYFCELHHILGRQARWLETLADYDFTFHHIPGVTNTVADLLSCRPDLNGGVNPLNKHVTVLPDHLFAKHITLAADLDTH
jgi:hypothetical protein